MSGAPDSAEDRVEHLRRAFDEAFMAPARPDAGEQVSLLAVRVAGDAYALRVHEIAELARARKVVAVPAPLPEFLGVAGIRGGLVPVYDLAALLGYGLAPEAPTWLALCGREELVGLGFTAFEGYLRVPRSELYVPGPGEVRSRFVTEVVRAGSTVRSVVDLRAVVESIRGRAGAAGTP